MKITFDTNGNTKQKEVAKLWIDKTTEEIVYGGSKGSGKSYLGCSLIFGDAFIYPETQYFIARKTLNDLRKFTIPSIHEVFKHWGINDKQWKFNGQDNIFYLNNGSRVYLLDAKDMPSDPSFERFGSMQMTRGWIEEAGEFSTEAKNNLSASVGRWKNEEYGLVGKLLMTCNPSKNFLYFDYYQLAKKDELPEEKKFIQALPEDNKMIDAGYLDRLKRTLSKDQKERLLFGNWEYDDDPTQLVSYEAMTDLFTNTVVEDLRKYLVVDVARLGKDKTVLHYWIGNSLIETIEYKVQDLAITAEKIREFVSEKNIPYSHVVIDENGVGGGLVDMLRGVKGFMSQTAPTVNKFGLKNNYRNFKSQCAFTLANKINMHEIAVKTDKHKQIIIDELSVLKSDRENPEKYGIIKKDDMKDLLGRSPDHLDCLIMRMYFELYPVVNRQFEPEVTVRINKNL